MSEAIEHGTGEYAYDSYCQVVDYKNFQGDPVPKWEDLPEKIQQAWDQVAFVMTAVPLDDDPTIESKRLRQGLDKWLQVLKSPFSYRTSRERSLAITKLQEAIMWLGMDLKAQKEEGLTDQPNPYPDSYDPSNTKVAPTADDLKL